MDECDRYFIIFVIIILFLMSLVFIKFYKFEEKSYSFDFIELDNDNVIIYGVVDYLCSDGVEVSHYWGDDFFYASTWNDAKVHSGKCFVKVEK